MKKTEAQSIGEIIHEVFRRAGMETNEAEHREIGRASCRERVCDLV